jgi:hypothetical protein
MTKEARKALYEAYAWFVAAYREAADKLKKGDRDAAFPPGSFPRICRSWPSEALAWIDRQESPRRPSEPPVVGAVCAYGESVAWKRGRNACDPSPVKRLGRTSPEAGRISTCEQAGARQIL